MFGFFGGPGGGVFEARYRAMPVAFIEKQAAEFGDKVILPPSALDRLASLHIEYPMLFKIESTGGRSTHCGVLEFVADEGVVYMPHWMMQNMLLEVGDMVKVRNVSLPKGTYVKLQPVTSDFLDISNPKAVLERTLRSYTCLTVGDVFVVHYNNKTYELEVKEAKPGPAISVVETDCQVDFEAPKDYKEPGSAPPPAPKPMQADTAQAGSSSKTSGGGGGNNTAAQPEVEEEPTFLAFAGTGRRLDGRTASASGSPVPVKLGGNRLGTSGVPSTDSRTAGTSNGSNGGNSNGVGGKAGTFVSTGNRLLDKLAREQANKTGSAPQPAPKPEATAAKPDDKSNSDKSSEASQSFKAFQGKGYSLKG